MTDAEQSTKPDPVPQPRSVRRPVISTGVSILAATLLVIMAVGYCGTRVMPRALGRNETRVTHDVVVQQVRAVAKLVSSEAVVRDVVTYENTWYGSTKRSLVVVTGRLLAGIDLGDNPGISIDHDKRRITILMPPAKLLGVEVMDMKTYDERGGLWNPFRPSDRDVIQRQVRSQLTAAGSQVDLLRKANDNAVEMLKLLLSKDGYTVEVTTRGAPRAPFVD